MGRSTHAKGTERIGLLLVAAMLCVGCRAVAPDAGLPPILYSSHVGRIVSNDRGAWFAIVQPATEKRPYVVVGDGAERELFYALWLGDRTARLMPVTPGAYALLDVSRAVQPTMQWLNSPVEVALPDPIGLLEPGAKVVWNQPVPDQTAVALVKARIDHVDVADWLVGAASVQNGDVTFASEQPLIVLPDGNVAARPVRAVSSVALPAVDGVTQQPLQAVVDATTEFTTRPAVLRHGADALVALGPAGLNVTLARPVIQGDVAIAVTSLPTQVVDGADAANVLLALRDIGAGRHLNAARQLLESGKSDKLRRFRVAELLGAAGYVDWGRAMLLDHEKGLGPDIAFYLARAHLLSGDLDRALDFVERSHVGFATWDAKVARAGVAQTLLLAAQIRGAQRDASRAYDNAVNASQQFAQAGDAMRAGTASLAAANYAVESNDLATAVEAAATARSYFHHGGSAYYTARTEVVLGDFYLAANDLNVAAEMAASAQQRFAALGDEIGATRVALLQARILAKTAPADGVANIRAALDAAQRLSDAATVVDAAAVLVSMGAVAPEMTTNFGVVLAVGVRRVEEPHIRRRAYAALARLCDGGLNTTVQAATQFGAADRHAVADACASTQE